MNWQRALVGAERPFGPRVGMQAQPPAHGPIDVPTIGPRGRLTYRDNTVYLSERDALLASVFVYYFGSEVTDVEVLDRVWPEGTTRWMLLRHLKRLDRRLARVGLHVVEVADRAHALRPAGAT